MVYCVGVCCGLCCLLYVFVVFVCCVCSLCLFVVFVCCGCLLCLFVVVVCCRWFVVRVVPFIVFCSLCSLAVYCLLVDDCYLPFSTRYMLCVACGSVLILLRVCLLCVVCL